MTHYRRAYSPDAAWLFTVNLAARRGHRRLSGPIDEVRRALEYAKQRRPFRMEAVVILPDHLPCIETAPADEADFSTRWNLLKRHFSRSIEKGARVVMGYSNVVAVNNANDALPSSAHPTRAERHRLGLLNLDSSCSSTRVLSTESEMPKPL